MIKKIIIIIMLLMLSACTTPNTGTITIPEGAHVTIESITTITENQTNTTINILNKGNETIIKIGE